MVSSILATFFLFFPIVAFYSKEKTMLVSAQTAGVAVGKAECVMELHSRRILYAKNATTTLPIASTTKIVTAAAILETNKNLQETIRIPKEAEGVEGSSVYLKCGDLYTIEELLYGLLLRSGNDCATALALHSSGSLAMFSNKMNDIAKAKEDFFKVIELRVDYAYAYYALGLACEKEENLSGAIENYEYFVQYSEDKNLKNNIQNKINNLKKKLPVEEKKEDKEIPVLE